MKEYNNILFLCKCLCNTKLTEMEDLLEIMDKIKKYKIIELVSFSIEIKNCLFEFEEKLNIIYKEIKYEFDTIMKFKILVKNMKHNHNINQFKNLFCTIKKSISDICYQNKTLKIFIDNFKKMKRDKVILNGLEFLYGIFNGLKEGNEKENALILTKMLNNHWISNGVSHDNLFPQK